MDTVNKQLSLYDLTRQNYKIPNKIRLIELFAGIGSQAKALKNLGADFETWKVVEFDRYAIASYNAVHSTDFPTIDITEIKGDFLEIKDVDEYTYIMTYSFPCQDLSVAGHRRGMGKGTRSGLLWEVERLLNEVENLPQVLLMENVPMVHSKDNISEFTEWIEFLRSKGYSNFWQDLNAKDYGVAQNRDRCFMVSILGEWNYNFPDPIPLTKCMKDYLEDTVDEKFYINSPKAQKLIEMLLADGVEPNQAVDGTLGNPRAKEIASSIIARYDAGIQNKPKWGTMYFEKCDPVILTGMGSESDDREPGIRKTRVATTLLARDYKGLDNYGSNGVLQLVGQMDNSDGTHESQNRVYSPRGLAPTITTQSGGNLQPKTLECKAVGHIEHGTGRHQSNTVYSDSGLSPTLTTIENGGTQQIKVIGNYMPGEHEAGRVVDENGLCPTVKENHGTTTATVVKDNRTSYKNQSELRIRKLTPRETWRLMDFDDQDYDKAAKVNSQTQLYKQAGNSIVVGVLEAILGEML